MAETRQYVPSDAVKAALEAAEENKGSRPGEYRSAWERQLKEAMERILNREDFRYNLNGDALYQQYKDQAIRNGRLAMMDTMGQAAALTGGYGSSYSQNAGQQAYQQSLMQLNDRIPELYSLAMQQYQMQGQRMKDQYDLLSGAEETDYGRYRDALGTWQKDQDRLWSMYTDARDFDYGQFRDSVSDEQWQKEFDEALRRWKAAQKAKQQKKTTTTVIIRANGTGNAGTGSSGGTTQPGSSPTITV